MPVYEDIMAADHCRSDSQMTDQWVENKMWMKSWVYWQDRKSVSSECEEDGNFEASEDVTHDTGWPTGVGRF
jgi:hypothetical protein